MLSYAYEIYNTCHPYCIEHNYVAKTIHIEKHSSAYMSNIIFEQITKKPEYKFKSET